MLICLTYRTTKLHRLVSSFFICLVSERMLAFSYSDSTPINKWTHQWPRVHCITIACHAPWILWADRIRYAIIFVRTVQYRDNEEHNLLISVETAPLIFGSIMKQIFLGYMTSLWASNNFIYSNIVRLNMVIMIFFVDCLCLLWIDGWQRSPGHD